MELTILAIMFISGTVSGTIAGVFIAGLFTQRKLTQKEKETWAQAENFYRRAASRS